MPPAFVRRCLVLNISVEGDFKTWINDRARAHFRDPEDKSSKLPVLSNEVLKKAADYLVKDREDHQGEGPKPGLAEYLDLLRGLYHIAQDNETEQLQWLERVYQFAFQKHATNR